MRELAEVVLSQVMERERAASIVGDLVEGSASRVTLWLSVARIGGSLVCRDLCAQPVRMLALAGGGAVMQAVFLTPFGAVLFLTAFALGWAGARLGHDMTRMVEPLFAGLVVSAAIPAPYLAGRWMARRSEGRELAPCLLLGFLAYAVWVAAYASLGENITLMNGLSGAWPTLGCLTVALVSLHAGALMTRGNAGWSFGLRKRGGEVLVLSAAAILMLRLPLDPPALDFAIRVLAGGVSIGLGIGSRPFHWGKMALFTAVGILVALPLFLG